MKIYKKTSVLEEAKARISFLFDEFPNIIVSFSGGKDSTACLHLTLEEAKKRGRLPQKVLFIDQEAEFDATIDYMKEIMERLDVEPLWFQMPIRIFNATSHSEKWLWCWKEGSDWIRPKSQLSIKENNYGTDRFHDLFAAILNKDFGAEKTAYIAGVRAEESPSRSMSLTYAATYKHITYGKILDKKREHYTFYPLYDWSYRDIWKYINDGEIRYNRIYDYQYRHGLQIKDMRVSNIHHETAVHVLFYLQEVEPDLWNRVVGRLDGINTAGIMGREDFYKYDLPYMFKNWKEYRDFLLDKLIVIEEDRAIYKKKFDAIDKKYTGLSCEDVMIRACVNALILNDFEFTTLGNRERAPENYDIVKRSKRGESL
jgi:predicted phosphoadenosine phosphosulfate sulfurtransferase